MTENNNTTTKAEYVPTHKTYELKTYSDMIALSPEQFVRMVEDFKTWKVVHDKLKAEADKVALIMNMKSEDILQLPDGFEWIDDGEHAKTIGVKVLDATTREVVAEGKVDAQPIYEGKFDGQQEEKEIL